MAALKLVLDTNVLLSGIAYPTGIPGKIVSAWRHGSVEVLLSGFILLELRNVLPRLAKRYGLWSTEMDDLVDSLYIQAEVIEPPSGSDNAYNRRYVIHRRAGRCLRRPGCGRFPHRWLLPSV